MEEIEIEKPKINYGKRNKTKGSNAERLYAKLFREAGYSHCRTAREGSKLHDDSGIDLMFLPVLVQVKAGKQKGMNPSKVLMDMDIMIAKNFPPTNPEHNIPRIVIHHKDAVMRGKGYETRTDYDQIVHMTFKTFIALLNNQKT